MTSSSNFTTPKEALHEMLAAGADFTVRHREDCLGISFSYRVADGGDAQRCKEVLAAVKSRPPIFFQAFRAAVQDVMATGKRGAA